MGREPRTRPRRARRTATGATAAPKATATAIAIAVTIVAAGCGTARRGTARTAASSRSVTTAPLATTATVPPATSTTAPPRPVLGTAPATTPAPARAPVTAPCPATLAGQLAKSSPAAQMVTVEAPHAGDTFFTLTAWQRTGGCWRVAGGPWSGRIGGQGFSDHHREGDNTTPTGAYGFSPVMYGNAPNPGTRYGYHSLVCGDWWDEDPSSSLYNTFQHVPCGQQPPFAGGSEALWQEQAAYPSFAVVDYNMPRAVPGAGSAIFLHADTGSSTAGCVSIPLSALDQLLRWLDPAASPLIVLGPSDEIARF